jgi:hypothetical protein
MARNAEVDLTNAPKLPVTRIPKEELAALKREMKARKLPSLSQLVRVLLREAIAK